ncbi:hypothetical protein BaRGS_00012512 [Batillaria attramentaria]|uniref:Uncharacterized protein n=1 Tax=Batillaria attramentaria TaxID=370345 RepID=A0ABD0LB21_9CAEN
MGFLHFTALCVALLVANSGTYAATVPPPPATTTQPLLPPWLFTTAPPQPAANNPPATTAPPAVVAGNAGTTASGGIFNVAGPFFTTTPAPAMNNPAGTNTGGNQPPPPSLQDILNDPSLWVLTGTPGGNTATGPQVVGGTLPGQQGPMMRPPSNFFNSIFPFFMGENIRNMALANTITNQIPGIGGTLLANNALDLPDRWLPFQVIRSTMNPAMGGQRSRGFGMLPLAFMEF